MVIQLWYLFLFIASIFVFPEVVIPILLLILAISLLCMKRSANKRGMTFKTYFKDVIWDPPKKAKYRNLNNGVGDWRQPFGCWKRSHHRKNGQELRYYRSIHDNMEILWISDDDYSAEICGTTGVIYETTLCDCTCPDFEYRNLPCKHMYMLARAVGEID